MPRKISIENQSSIPENIVTPLGLHIRKWGRGCGAEDCRHACKIVLGGGMFPCDVLIIGEGPGKNENQVGESFVGPAGHLLKSMIKEAESNLGCALRYGTTNVVGCKPLPWEGQKANEPGAEALELCAPRVTEIIEISRCKMVLCAGKVAEDWVGKGWLNSPRLPQGVHKVGIRHPSSILQQKPETMEYLRTLTTLHIQEALERFVLPNL